MTLVVRHDEKFGVREGRSGPVPVPGQRHGRLQHLHRGPRLLVLLHRREGGWVVGEDAAVDTAHTAGQAALAVLEAGLLRGVGGVHDVLHCVLRLPEVL